MPLFRRAAALLALPLIAAAMSAPALADVKSGVDAWQRGDYAAAVAEWRPLAVAGDADAQFNLGQAYKLGRGVPTDLTQAEAWYRRAAQQGHLQAEDNLGLVLFTANRREEAMSFIARSAARGEPRAQYVLGTAHFNGDLAPKDWPLAYALTKRASDAGLELASARLSQLDGLIPLEQRQRGLAMLPQMERDEQRARLAAVNAAAPPPAAPVPSPIKTASLPASTPAAGYTPPPVIAPAPAPAAKPLPSPAALEAAAAAAEAAAAAASAAPGTSYTAPPVRPEQAKPQATKPESAKAAPAAAPAASGPWRAQFGAFGVEANARNLWTSLAKKHPALAARQPHLVKSGKLTRLQAGGFASKAEAESLCAAVRKDGQACLVVDK
jgi:TPR repeat protein